MGFTGDMSRIWGHVGGDYSSYSVAEMGLRVRDWIEGNREREDKI